MQHLLTGKELNRANMIVIDPRFTRNGRSRQRICAHPPGHGHSSHLGHVVAHLSEQLGRQGLHPETRLRHGRRSQGSREVDAGRSGTRFGRSRRAAQARRTDVRAGQAFNADLVHGRDATHGRHGDVRAFCILCLATGNVGKPGTGANIFRGHTNVQGATTLGSMSRLCLSITGSSRARGVTGRGMGCRIRLVPGAI